MLFSSFVVSKSTSNSVYEQCIKRLISSSLCYSEVTFTINRKMYTGKQRIVFR
jgi:hypothetical protein